MSETIWNPLCTPLPWCSTSFSQKVCDAKSRSSAKCDCRMSSKAGLQASTMPAGRWTVAFSFPTCYSMAREILDLRNMYRRLAFQGQLSTEELSSVSCFCCKNTFISTQALKFFFLMRIESNRSKISSLQSTLQFSNATCMRVNNYGQKKFKMG